MCTNRQNTQRFRQFLRLLRAIRGGTPAGEKTAPRPRKGVYESLEQIILVWHVVIIRQNVLYKLELSRGNSNQSFSYPGPATMGHLLKGDL